MQTQTVKKNQTGTVSLFILTAIVAAFMSIEAKSAAASPGAPAVTASITK
jgi:hypothetical protein